MAKNIPTERISDGDHTSPAKGSDRNYGIDLLRMVSMYMVCMLHVLGQGGMLQASSADNIRSNIVWFFEIAAFCAVNCFALISGYVGCRSSFKPYNLFRLWACAVFYTFGISLIFKLAAPGSIDGMGLFRSLFPICTGVYWYLTAYAIIFFITPQMNFLLANQERKTLRNFIWAFFFLFSVMAMIPILSDISAPVILGYSALWLAYLYMIGGFIKIYGASELLPEKPSVRAWIGRISRRPSSMLLGYFACVGITVLLFEAGHRVLIHFIGYDLFFAQYVNYNSPTILFAAIFLLLYFSRLNVSRFRSFIRLASPLAFSVYLIQNQTLIWVHLFSGAFVWAVDVPIWLLPLEIIFIPLGIYIVCSVIDYIRLRIFKLLRLA